MMSRMPRRRVTRLMPVGRCLPELVHEWLQILLSCPVSEEVADE